MVPSILSCRLRHADVRVRAGEIVGLAALPLQELDARLAGLELTRFTAATITDPAALYAELDRIRERGYAVDQEEVEECSAEAASAFVWDGSAA